MDKKNNKWGFLAPTRKEAKRMEKKYGVHFTPLIDYMKVIFPDIDDWKEEQYMVLDVTDDGKFEYVKHDLYSENGHKIVSIFDAITVYDENYISTGDVICSPLSYRDGDIYYIDKNTQLTNAMVKQIFGVDVNEPLFDENTPTYTQPWVISFSENAETALKGKYIGDEKQYQINFDAYRALYDNVGLSKIIVENLFDSYSYEIELNTDRNIAILIGPNGCGKTTILKIVRFMLSGAGNIKEIMKTPFKSITCKLVNGRMIKLESSNGIICAYIDDKKVTKFGEDENDYDFHSILREHGFYFNTEFMSDQRVLNQIDEVREGIPQYFSSVSKIGEDFKSFCEKTERYYNAEKSSAEHRLLDKYIGLKEEILEYSIFKNKWKIFSEKRNECEYNEAFYPYSDCHPYSDILIKKRENTLIEEYKNYSDDKKEFFCLYLNLFENTLSEIEKANKKTKLFQKIINDRFKITKKHLHYRYREMYLTVGDNKKEISFDVLSSGEKNDFIMFYNLIFNCEDSKVFIDEPEISLHIDWQEHYISDLYKICKMNNIQALVATHSPHIIYDHTDLIAKWETKDEH